MRSGKCSQFKTLIEEFDKSRSMVALSYYVHFHKMQHFEIFKIAQTPLLPTYVTQCVGTRERGEGGRPFSVHHNTKQNS
jgi:hypothetical protein